MLNPCSIREASDPGLTSAIASATTKSSLSIAASNCCASMQFARSLSLVVGMPGMGVAAHGTPRAVDARRAAVTARGTDALTRVMTTLLLVTAAFMVGCRTVSMQGLDAKCGDARPSRGCGDVTRKTRAWGRRRALWRAPTYRAYRARTDF